MIQVLSKYEISDAFQRICTVQVVHFCLTTYKDAHQTKEPTGIGESPQQKQQNLGKCLIFLSYPLDG